MYGHVMRFTQRCLVCQFHNRPTTLPHGLSHPIPPPSVPFHTVGIDFVGPFPPSNGNTHIMTLICHTTRYVEAWPVSSPNTSNSIKILEKHVIFRHSTPKRIVLDNGSAFTANMFTTFSEKYNIQLQFNPIYYHEPNGICERHNGTITSILRKRVSQNPKDWSKYLHEATFAINTTVHSVTRFTPFFLVYGRNPNLPIDNLLPTIPDCLDDNESRVAEKRLQTALPIANANTVEAQEKERAKHDSRHTHLQFKVGDLVLMKNLSTKKNETRKLKPIWKGPYEVINHIPDKSSVQIQRHPTPRNKVPKLITAHVSHLKLFLIPEKSNSDYEDSDDSDTLSSIISCNSKSRPPSINSETPETLNPESDYNEFDIIESEISNSDIESLVVPPSLDPVSEFHISQVRTIQIKNRGAQSEYKKNPIGSNHEVFHKLTT